MKLEIDITATEKEALRRAIAGLAADEAKRWLGRKWPEPVNVGEHEERLNVIREKIGGRR